MHGNGDGTFTAGAPLSAPYAYQISIGDFNGDGNIDAALLNPSGSAVSLLFGNGDGSFDMQAPVFTGNDPTSITTGDFNGDGFADIATANAADNTVLLSEPSQTASTAPTLIAPAEPGQHQVKASYAGNSNFNPSFSAGTVLWGQPPVTTTTMTVTSAGSTATALEPGTVITLTATVKTSGAPLTSGEVDFCDTASPDCTDLYRIGRAWLTANGSAIFRYTPGPGHHGVKATFEGNAAGLSSSSAAVTFNVNSPPHVIQKTEASISQSGNIGDYTLTETVVETGSAAPLSGSLSFLDTSYSNAVLASTKISASTPGLAWQNSLTIAQAQTPKEVSVTGDFNSDGIADIVATSFNSAALTVLLGKGDGSFTAAASPTASQIQNQFPYWMAAGDFNSDGKLDIAVLSVASGGYGGNLVFLLGNGDGTFAATAGPAMSQNPMGLAVADFNGDGRLDLIIGDYNQPATLLLGNSAGSFTPVSATGVTTATPQSIAAGDLNGDGFPDLAIIANNAATIYLSNGDGTFRAGDPLPAIASYAFSITLGDLNGDGIPDLAIGDTSGIVSTLLGKGDGTFTSAPVTADAGSMEPASMAIGDFNKDGRADLAVAGFYSNAVLLGNGDGTFSASLTAPVTDIAFSIAVADFNHDGIQDIVVGNRSGVAAFLTQPTQTATFTASQVSPSGPAPHLVKATYGGDANYAASASSTVSLDVQAATPVISPGAGTYTAVQTVTISDATPGVTIYYTTNGVYPSTASTVYTGPITIGAQNETIEAVAVETGYQNSEIASANFTLKLQPPSAPVISLASGVYPGAQTVTISDPTPGAAIYFAINGPLPTTSSSLYTGPITISTSETLVAIGANGYAVSPAVSAQYTISSSAASFIYTVAGSGSVGYSGDGGPATAADLGLPAATVHDAAGNLYLADEGNNIVRKVAAATGIITTIAGNGTAGYSGDGGPAVNAKLAGPQGLALDGAGNLYIADSSNNVIRRVALSSGVISTYAGNGTAGCSGDNGPASSAALGDPTGLALDAQGNLYVAQEEYNCVRKIAAGSGSITTVAGNGGYGYSGDGGPATSSSLSYPSGLALDSGGNLYIAEVASSLIRKVTASTGTISTVAGIPSSSNGPSYGYSGDGGLATSAKLNQPEAVAVDAGGNLYIADTYNQAIRKVAAGTGVITTVAGNGSICQALAGDSGPAASASLCYPQSVSVDKAGNLYIAEGDFPRIREVMVSALPPTAKTASPSFQAAAGSYASPQTVTITSSTPGSAIYVTLDGSTPSTGSYGYHGPIAVTGNVTIQAMAVAPGFLPSAPASAAYAITSKPASIISTAAGSGVFGEGATAGPAGEVAFGYLQGIAVDSAGNLYLSDLTNSIIWFVSAKTGKASIFAGTSGRYGYFGDGGAATAATFADPQGLALDAAGNLYIADAAANVIRKVTASTGVISTVAGNNQSSVLGDGGPATAARLFNPSAVALDGAGNLFIADTYDNRVREVSAATGVIITVAGNGNSGFSGDGGPATAAALQGPTSLTIDNAGNLYIASAYARVRKVAAGSGVITTVAGNGVTDGSSGDGGPATSAAIDPTGLAVDSAGNLYLSNWPASVREVDAKTGIIQEAAGNGYPGYSGDGGSATIAEIQVPQGIALDRAGDLYIIDQGNYRVRKVTPAASLTAAATPGFSVPAGSYASAQAVAITDGAVAATIYYTTDGTIPTLSSSIYSGPITVSQTETLKAFATAPGYVPSAIASAAYSIKAQATPTITITPSATAITTVQALTVTVSVSGGGDMPTGTVTLISGSYGRQQTLASGSASFTLAAGTLPAGNDTLTATYVPDSASAVHYTGATQSDTVSVTTIGAGNVTVSITPSATVITDEQAITVAVSVRSGSGQPGPTGLLTLSSGSYNATQPVSDGAASFHIPAGTFSAGANTISANYFGDATYGAASGSATVTVSPVAIAPPAPPSVSPGGSATGTVTFAAGSAYSGTLNLTCSLIAFPSGAKSLPTCSLAPANITIASGATQTSVLTVQTTKGNSSVASMRRDKSGSYLLDGGETMLAAVLVFLFPVKRRRRVAGLGLLLIAIVGGAASGCGGGSQGSTPPPSNIPPTTAGSYTFAVTGTDVSNAAVSISAKVIVTVQ